ncbi:NrfD/PsrC family molybdoenzyme membrane anchor subunit [Corynebacterium halotolerans]|uniref:Polysulfide reductase NrfD n=1 Tax=Corynebacterium halotolerans YIM 70093 = DSM 44683 TaxID=1121362 RepID=M1NRE2_9CORY|nr:NrfD/PsrC family molybdoenzyme membrane anchor subunit [Corynebacterium halotolerans]AGF72072.1 polysulfide reductase NrfD [Corynebacterium halotolerans YIM 70093 = DSM 44683]
MTTSRFDSLRPPEKSRKRRDGGKKKKRNAWLGSGGDGSRPMPMVPEAEFSSYYGRQVVKAPPWENPIAIYLFLGGVAGGSALLSVGGQLTGRTKLRRNGRLAALGGAALGSLALVADLGRPERFLNMLRTFKLSSPMSVGSWILVSFATPAGVAAVAELDDMTGRKVPLPKFARNILHKLSGPAGLASGALGAPLAVYTSVLLSDTAVPTWNAAKDHLPFVFVSSASLASGGLAMITTPVEEAGPARALAVAGAVGDVVATRTMDAQMDPVANEPMHQGRPGKFLRLSEKLVIGGGLGALLGGRNRIVAAASGAALLAGSALTRFGVLHAGLNSAKDPRYTVEPQKRRLAERQAQGKVADSITTVR